MSEEFKVIETQEDFDKAIQKRLAQKDKELAERYKDFLSPDAVIELRSEYDKQLQEMNDKLAKANEKLAGHDQIVADLTTRANTAESDLLKSRVAHESGVPFELAGRLVGSNEEELKADAERFASFLAPKAAPPLRTNDPTSNSNGSMAAMVGQINQQFAQS
jgi:hypothetical protein